jgi:outer membrane biosynthesis protein TonB
MRKRMWLATALALFLLTTLALSSSDPPTPEEEPVPLTGADDVTKPSVIKKTRKQPKYPRDQKARGDEAKLIFEAVVQKQGSVGSLKLIGCRIRNYYLPIFRQAEAEECAPFESSARTAISKWRYEPARREGEPVDAWVLIQVDFVLN